MISGILLLRRLAQMSAILAIAASSLVAQETVFNVPSADVLDRGKVYAEFDFSYRHSDDTKQFTPRVVVGAGHDVELGLNLNGLGAPGDQHTMPTPTVKWKFYDGRSNGWSALAGDDLFIPVQNRTFDAGNYVYLELAHQWKSGARATFGAYHFTRDVVSTGQRAGGQFAFEQPVNKTFGFATDWFTGAHALGFVSPGVVVKISPKITGYATYELGNRDLTHGNHQLLVELGWNLN